MTGFPLQIEADVRRRLEALGVKPVDVEERFIRGTGPGGQKINKTASTVWLRHGPTGVQVRCQAERSQVVNRARAWAELCAKLEARRAAAAAERQAVREVERRRTRQKSRVQKARMIEAKKHRARLKQTRRGAGDW
jgi:peptide chain release factor